MVKLEWGSPSLGVAYEKFTGKIDVEESNCSNPDADPYATRDLEEAVDDNWNRGVENWKGVLILVSEPQPPFLRTLSTTQRRSLRLLLEWWTAVYQHEWEASDYRDHVLRDYDSLAENDPMDHSKDADYRRVDMEQLDGYGARLLWLWMHEFCQYDRLHFHELERSLAARVAACQRVSFGLLAHHRGKCLEDASNVMLQNLEWYDNGLPIGGVIEACPWLSEDQRKGLPFYLWDVAQKRAVRTQDLRPTPVYTVISHTWGRWLLKDKPHLTIPGVPWPVPQNSRFSIENLPDVLAEKSKQFLPATHIWFDLFCIPQDRSELSRIEIARQAAIFGGAHQAIAWLNYVEDWKGLVFAIQYMVSYWLDRDKDVSCRLGRRVLRPRLDGQPGFNATLWAGYTYKQDSSFYEVEGEHGWFTSLWTLQELYLRPDMLLADRNWNICRCPHASNSQPLTIDTLVAVTWSAKPYIIEETCTRSTAGLIALVMGAGLDQLLEPHPLSPLCLGSRRQCTERRAEAIMSVVGATRWYDEVEDPDKNLVLGHYPVEFLRELHGDLGAMFFRTSPMRSPLSDTLLRATINAETDKWKPFNAGGMLPFDPWDFDSRMVFASQGFGTSDHPTTDTWTIGDEGEVYMTEVAIVASTDDELCEDTNHDLVAVVYMPTKDSWSIRPTQGNLHEALREFVPSFMKHAVCLLERSDGYCEGVILIHLHSVLYAKLGYFTIPASDEPLELQTWEIGRWEVI